MQYLSTRDATATPLTASFDEVLLAGLAPDGGLYVPRRIPTLAPAEIAGLASLSYGELAARIIAPFAGTRIGGVPLASLIADSYAGFGHQAVAPLKELDSGLWLMELFHGPTLAFKDYALQLVGRLFDALLNERGERVTIVGATSGDTGSAAIEACRDRDAIDLFILYPQGRVSEVQRRQMTTVASANVHAIAVAGTFDDCQDLVKAMFADTEFRERLNLSAVNSINWARIVGQIVYYFAAAVVLGAPHRPVSFSVPTGNFGNVYAAHMARRMGLPIAQLVVATNRNDILARFLTDGRMTIGHVEPSLSPSMDIQVSSNFGELLDPHSAVAVAAARAVRHDKATPMVALACAHPAKFPDAVEAATGVRPPLPPHLADLMTRRERIALLPNDIVAVQRYVSDHARPVAVPPRRVGGAA